MVERVAQPLLVLEPVGLVVLGPVQLFSQVAVVLQVLVVALIPAMVVPVELRTVLLREQADDARERERRTAALFTLGQELGAVENARDAALAVVRQVRALFGGDAAVFLPDATLEKPRLAPHGGESSAWATEREEAVAGGLSSYLLRLEWRPGTPAEGEPSA